MQIVVVMFVVFFTHFGAWSLCHRRVCRRLLASLAFPKDLRRSQVGKSNERAGSLVALCPCRAVSSGNCFRDLLSSFVRSFVSFGVSLVEVFFQSGLVILRIPSSHGSVLFAWMSQWFSNSHLCIQNDGNSFANVVSIWYPVDSKTQNNWVSKANTQI